jgi:hypothetical protein
MGLENLVALPGVAGRIGVWLILALFLLIVLRTAIGVLDAALALRNKWLRRPRGWRDG